MPKPHESGEENVHAPLKPKLLYTKSNLYVLQWHVSTKNVVMAPAQGQIGASMQDMRGAGPNALWRGLGLPD